MKYLYNMLQNFTSIPLGLNGIFDLHFTTIKVSSCYVQIQNSMDGTQYMHKSCMEI